MRLRRAKVLERQFREKRERLDRLAEEYRSSVKKTDPVEPVPRAQPWEKKRRIKTRRGWRDA